VPEIKEEKPVKPLIDIPTHYWDYIVMGFILLFVLLVRSQFLSIGLERDEGIYTYFGKLILEGKRPYIDFYEMRLPGIFYMYAVLVGIFGFSIQGIAAGIMLLNMGTILLLYRVGTHLFNRQTGWIIGASYAFLSLMPSISGFTRQSEHIVTFFIAAALWTLIKGFKHEKKYWFFLSGALMCLGVITKANAVFIGIALGLWIIAYHTTKKERDIKSSIIDGLVYSAGVMLVLGAMCLLIISQGAWKDMNYWAFEYANKYVGQITWKQGQELFNMTFEKLITDGGLFFWGSIVGLILTLFVRTEPHKKIGLWVLWIASALTITPGLRFYGHYWLLWMPAVALGVGLLFWAIQNLAGNGAKWVYAGFIAVALLQITAHSDYYFSADQDKILRSTYGLNPFPEAKIIGEEIKKRANKEDKIVVIGSEPQMHIYTGLGGITKHNYIAFLMSDTTQVPEAKIWIKEFTADIEKTKPRFLVFFRHGISILAGPKSDMSMFQWVDSFIPPNYKRIGVADILSNEHTEYRWDGEAASFQPKSQYNVFVFEKQ
jgi:hypothetical protein